MKTFAILRRSGRHTPADLDQAAGRSKEVADEQMSDDVRWIRSYVLEEASSAVGTVCIYQATDETAIERHADPCGAAGR